MNNRTIEYYRQKIKLLEMYADEAHWNANKYCGSWLNKPWLRDKYQAEERALGRQIRATRRRFENALSGVIVPVA